MIEKPAEVQVEDVEVRQDRKQAFLYPLDSSKQPMQLQLYAPELLGSTKSAILARWRHQYP